MNHKTFSILALAALLLAGCSRKGTGPGPVQYRLYAGVHGGPGSGRAYIAVIDCSTDSIIDSFPTPLRELIEISVSPDGRYLGAPTIGRNLIWDLSGFSQAAILPSGGSNIFAPRPGSLILSERDSTVFYGMPGFQREGVVKTELHGGSVIPGQPYVIGIDNRLIHTGPGPNLLRIVDYRTREMVDSVVIAPDPGEPAMSIVKFVLSPDGKRLYALGTRRGNVLIGYDLETRRVLFRRTGLFSPWGYCRVSPDGREVWFTDAAYLEDLYWPPYIFILDALTGVPLDSIDMRGYYPADRPGYEHTPLEPQDIRFLPSGEKAYVNCGRYFNGHTQPILVIDTRTRKVIKMLLDDFRTQLTESIDLAPAP